MKHFKQFFVFALLALFSVGAWGETIDFTAQGYANQEAVTSVSGTDCTITFDKGTNSNAPKYFTSGTAIRAYGGNTITIASASKTIEGITFTFGSSDGSNAITADEGTFSSPTWSGSASSVTFTIGGTSGNRRLASVEVTYASGSGSSCETLAAPTNPSATPAQTSVVLNWDAVANASGYKVVFNGTDYDIASGVTTKTIEGLAMETEYHWTVAAKGDGTTYCEAGTATAQQSVTTLDACTANKAVYTVATKSSVTPSGALEGSTATFANTYNTKDQMTNGNSQTLTLSGYDGATIKGLTLSMHSNASAGAGTFNLTIGSTTVASISDATTFNKWFDNTAFGNTYRNVHVSFADDVVVGTGEDIVVTIAATTNSLFCQSFTFCYDEPVAAAVEKPTFSLATGTYLGTQSVEINCATVGADIYYTLDGTEPSSTSTPYSSAISITETKTLKAIAIKGSDESAIASATYTIVAIEHAGTEVDPYSVADAVKVIDVLGTQDGVYVSGIVSQIVTAYNSTYGNITFNISADGATSGQQFQAYRCKSFSGANFSSADDVVVGATAVVYGNLKKHNSTYELDADCYLAAYEAPTTPKTSIANDKDHPYTVAQAITYAADGITYDLDDYVYVRGVVYDVRSFNSTNGTLDIYIKDAGESNQFELYKCAGINDGSTTTPFDALTDVQVDDEVIAYGQLTVFNTMSELKAGNYLVELNRPTVPVTSINLTESAATVEEGKTVTLHASVLPNNATDQDIVWTVVSGDTYASVDNGVVTGIAAGEAVIRAASHEEASIYAECTITVTEPAPLSPWATVYSSNVTVGAENYIIKILKPGSTTEYDEFEGMRYGTSGAAGVATITIPASTQALHFHAAAWNTENVTLEVKVGEETYPLTFGELVKEANIKGNGTTYELSTPIDEYYMLDLSSYTIADNTVITFTATGGNRFVLYGVNQEGGVLPVLESIEIGGDLTTKTGYKVGDALDLDGLTVSATYSLGGVAQTPVDITDKLGDGLTLTYDPLVEGQTEVTITATYEGETDDINITLDEAVASADPKIYVDKLNVNFGTVAKDAVVADQTITVTLTNVAAATAVLGGTNPEAFSINKTALVDGDVITISVASTATYGSYSAKITISDNAAEAEAKTVNLSLAVEDVETPVSTISKWVAAEAADLVDGAEVLITGVKDDVIYAMGMQNSNNRAAVAASVDGKGVLTPGEGTMAFTLVAQGDGTFALRTSNGKYLYAAASGSNHLKTQAEVDVNAKWTLTIASAVAEGSSNRNQMKFNGTSLLFSCYSSGQSAIALYTRAKEERAGFTVGKLATVCVPYAVAQEDIIGADVYEIAGKNDAGKIVFDQVTTGGMEAGVAYLVQAKAETATFYYSGDAVDKPKNEGALKGTFSEKDIPVADAANVYFFKDNALWSAKETGVKILANRAWLDMSAVGNAGPSPAPGRRRITMDVHGENAATGMDELNASEAPRKMIIDGQLYILRGEKMYNANGTLVK